MIEKVKLMEDDKFRRLMCNFEDFLESMQDAELLSSKGEEFRHEIWKRFVKE